MEAKIGDIWKTGNDEAKIEAAGLAPLQPQLDKITALNDTAAITRYLRDSQAEARACCSRCSPMPTKVGQRSPTSARAPGPAGEGYYFDDAQAKIRDAYVAYIAQVLTLSGVDAAQAEQAKAVMAFETRSAKARCRASKCVTRPKALQPAQRRRCRQADPELQLDRAVRHPEGAGRTEVPRWRSRASVKWTRCSPMPASTWQAYLRFHTIDDASPYLSSQFEKANFDFYGTTSAARRNAAALEARAGVGQRWHG